MKLRCPLTSCPPPSSRFQLQVSSGCTAWLGLTLLLKVILYMLGIPSGVWVLQEVWGWQRRMAGIQAPWLYVRSAVQQLCSVA